jgi:hypothetical protein
MLVQFYNGISHSDYTSTLGRLDEARTCGCSHLPIVAKEHRGL